MRTQFSQTQDAPHIQAVSTAAMLHKIQDAAEFVRVMGQEVAPIGQKARELEAGPTGAKIQPEGTWITTFLLVHHCLPAGL